MRFLTPLLLVAAIAVGLYSALTPAPLPAQPKSNSMQLAHNVYFSLNDNSEAAKQKLVAACKSLLADHPGTVFFAAGVLAEDLNRPVNDRDFDVALHLVFKDKAAHDQYSVAPKHMKFIEENKANWKKVRVFDSYLTP